MRLRQLRQARGLSQKELADAVSISYKTYNHYETEKRCPTIQNLVVLADFFDVSVDYILERTEEPEMNRTRVSNALMVRDGDHASSEEVAECLKLFEQAQTDMRCKILKIMRILSEGS